MANVQGPIPQKYHPKRRKELLATADVQIMQAQVIGKDGRELNVVFWICGPDIFYANTLPELFSEKRFKAPPWIREQLKTLALSKQFDCWGNAKSQGDRNPGVDGSPAPTVVVPPRGSIPTTHDSLREDDDLPGFKEAP